LRFGFAGADFALFFAGAAFAAGLWLGAAFAAGFAATSGLPFVFAAVALL
jgi:hypothetical protein